MQQLTEEQICKFETPADFVNRMDDAGLVFNIKETTFSKDLTDQGKDYCYFLQKIYCVDDEKTTDYACMAYTLNQPDNLERASVYDMVVEENEVYVIHRISVLRDGELIDKIPDTKIKILDSEEQSSGGVLNSSKKINVTIKDLRLYDILILEDSRIKSFMDKEFLRKKYNKYVWVSPNNYWGYGWYNFTFINNRDKRVAYKKTFFRDEKGNLIEPEIGYLEKGEKFTFQPTDYLNQTDGDREIFPYIDFATDSNWKDLSNYIHPFYDEVLQKENLESFAPDLVKKINAITNKDDQLQFAIEYVQNNIYYIYNADEMNGHAPQLPSITYNNKQGDCKAKSVLLKAILDYLNIPSSIVLVNFRTDFYIRYYLPSLLSFNHVIVKIDYKGETYFIDATVRDECGLIENRSFINFLHYLEIKPHQELQERKSYRYPRYCIDENIDVRVKENIGTIRLNTTYRYNRANNMRRYFKNTNKREIIDSWNNFLFYALNYGNDRSGTDIRNVFNNAVIEIVRDDKRANEFSIQYTATVDNPYYTDNKGNRFLMFYDRNVSKSIVRDYVHRDITYWHSFDSEKYTIHLYTDQKIDTREKYTRQECTIDNKYFDYKSRKKIEKNGATMYIEYNPTVNIEIPFADLEHFKKDYHKVGDSNFGLGIDIVKPGLLSFLKRF